MALYKFRIIIIIITSEFVLMHQTGHCSVCFRLSWDILPQSRWKAALVDFHEDPNKNTAYFVTYNQL